MTATDIANRLKRALSTFCERDLYLLQVDANERSISHEVAEYESVGMNLIVLICCG